MNKNSISKKITIGILGIFLILAILFTILNQFYINYMWFEELGYTQVFMRELISKMQIGVPFFFVIFILLFIYLKFLSKIINKKASVPIMKGNNKIIFGSSFIVSLFITLITTNALWYKLLEYKNSTAFNLTDPLYNKDISFYVFKLPFIEQLYTSITSILIIIIFTTILYTAFTYLSNPNRNIDLSGNGKFDYRDIILDFGNLAGKQIGVFLGLFFMLVAFGYYIKTFTLLYSTTGIAYGASYTDVNITLPIYRVLMVVSAVLGVFTIISGIQKKLKRLVIAPILFIVISLLGGLITFAVNNFIVAPNEFQKEEPYLLKNIQSTQAAYGIDKIEEKDFNVDSDITIDDIKENDLTVRNIPINDYRPTLSMFNSIQGFRIYYQFNDIDIDRYDVNGKDTQVFISAREMNNNKLEDKAKTWINTHLKYTHGFGISVAPVNEVNDAGQPSLIVKDIPPETDIDSLKVTEPRIYYGESTNTYAITNGKTKEFDYPEGSNNAENYYQGTGGIQMNLLNKLAFSLYHGDLKILLSSDITKNSKMLIKRGIMDRVNTIAPFLTYDKDPYIVVAKGKLYWIMDAFTVSTRYPYSQPYNEESSFNYIRNSVKVVVDAYNGDVNFYQVDKEDPITNVYNKIYPEMFKSIDKMPESIRDHVRYSQEMFDIQSNMYRTYHMNNSRVFYNREDQWEIATQIFGQNKEVEEVESAYLIMKQPETEREEFVLMVPYTPRQKDNMIGWMAAMNDKEQYGKLFVYKFPKQKLTYGPMQIEQRIDQDTSISPQLTLLGQQGSEVSRGNMLAIPINNSILYVEPVYIGASGAKRSIPEVKKVIVSYNNKIVMEDNFQKAIEKLFGTSQSNENNPNEKPETTENGDSSISRANELFKKAQEAQQSGNWAEYGTYIDELEKILNQLDK